MKEKQEKIITPKVWLLSFVSFFTDIATEMLFPILPLYFKSIGIDPFQIGLLESLSELILGFFKYLFGYLSDKFSNNWLFIRLGYIISAISKPLIGFTSYTYLVFFIRFTDRFSKAIRTAPRDSELISGSNLKYRGAIFGFHRAMDTLGATLGPVITFFILLIFFQGNDSTSQFTTIFYISFIPGFIVILLVLFRNFFIKNDVTEVLSTKTIKNKSNILDSIKKLGSLSLNLKLLLFGITFLSLLNASDMFVILRLEELGFDAITILALYILYNLTTTLLSLPVGKLADKFGHKNILLLLVLTASFALLTFSRNFDLTTAIFTMILYSSIPLFSEVVIKSWLSHYSDNENKASLMGLGLLFQSIGVALASVLVGLGFTKIGTHNVYNILSSVTILCLFYFLIFVKDIRLHDNIKINNTLPSCNPKH